MSRKHPQNGPSFGKAGHAKKKPLTEKELATRRARERQSEEVTAARVDQARRKVAAGKRFAAAVKANDGIIPLRGGNATDALDLARSADLVALVELGARRTANPVAARAHDLLLAIARSGDVHTAPEGDDRG